LVQEDETTSAATMAKAMASPFDVSGAAHADGTTALRLEGLEGSVSYRSHALASLLAGDVGTFDWAAQRDAHAFTNLEGDVWRISVKPSDGPATAEALRRLGAETVVFDWAGGWLWANAPEGQNLRKALDTISGHATVIRNTFQRHGSFHPAGAAIETLSSGLRRQFDPRGILNPGRL
jgi:glycolate oxidase FAD binding subunit